LIIQFWRLIQDKKVTMLDHLYKVMITHFGSRDLRLQGIENFARRTSWCWIPD